MRLEHSLHKLDNLSLIPKTHLEKPDLSSENSHYDMGSRDINATWKLVDQLARSSHCARSQKETLNQQGGKEQVTSESCPLTYTHKQAVEHVPRISHAYHTQILTSNNNIIFIIFFNKRSSTGHHGKHL